MVGYDYEGAYTTSMNYNNILRNVRNNMLVKSVMSFDILFYAIF